MFLSPDEGTVLDGMSAGTARLCMFRQGIMPVVTLVAMCQEGTALTAALPGVLGVMDGCRSQSFVLTR